MDTPQPAVTFKNVSKVFNERARDRVKALDDINLDIRPGEFVSLIGPSGCGKSTLLKILAGLLDMTKGKVMLDGTPVQAPRRDIGVMFGILETFQRVYKC